MSLLKRYRDSLRGRGEGEMLSEDEQGGEQLVGDAQ
jgi:hypothetical protein